MEYWNNGENEELPFPHSGLFVLFISHYSIIPIFQYSIIPVLYSNFQIGGLVWKRGKSGV